MTTEKIDIIISEDGSKKVKEGLIGISTSAEGAQKSVEGLNKSLGGLSVSEINKAKASFAGLTASMEKIKNESLSVVKSFSNLTSSFDSIGKNSRVFDGLGKSIGTQTSTLGVFNNQLINTISSINNLNSALTSTKTINASVKDGFIDVSRSAENAKKNVDAINKSFSGIGVSELNKAKTIFSNLGGSMQKIRGESSSVSKSFSSLTSSFDGIKQSSKVFDSIGKSIGTQISILGMFNNQLLNTVENAKSLNKTLLGTKAITLSAITKQADLLKKSLASAGNEASQFKKKLEAAGANLKIKIDTKQIDKLNFANIYSGSQRAEKAISDISVKIIALNGNVRTLDGILRLLDANFLTVGKSALTFKLSMQEVHKSISSLNTSLSKAPGNVNAFVKSLQSANAMTSKFRTTVGSVAPKVANLSNKMQGLGANTAKVGGSFGSAMPAIGAYSSALGSLGSKASGTKVRMGELSAVFASFTAFLGVQQLIQYADAWTRITSKIRIAIDDTKEAAAVQEQLFQGAQKTRQGLEGYVDLYSRTARAANELGASQQEVVKFTELVSKSLAISGTDAVKASGGIVQLGQALGNGVVRAEEYNSIIDAMPELLKVATKYIEGTGGSLTGLRKKMLDGKLTSTEFFNAVLKGSEELDSKFSKSLVTINQGFTALSNAMTKWIGETDQSLGLSSKFASLLILMANNMDIVAISALAMGGAIAIALIPTGVYAFNKALASLVIGFKMVSVQALAFRTVMMTAVAAPIATLGAVMSATLGAIATGLRTIFALMLANPITALITAFTALIGYLYVFRDEIKLGTDELTTMGDLFAVVFEDIGSLIDDVIEGFSFLGLSISNTMGEITEWISSATGDWWDYFAGFFDDVPDGWAGVIIVTARSLDTITGLQAGAVYAWLGQFTGFYNNVRSIFAQIYNFIGQSLTNWNNQLNSYLNTARSVIGIGDQIAKQTFTPAQVPEFKGMGQIIGDGIKKGLALTKGMTEDYATRAISKAQGRSKKRHIDGFSKQSDYTDQPKAKSVGAGGKAKKGGTGKGGGGKEKADRFGSELDSLIKQLSPMTSAVKDFEKSQNTLNEALSRGMISAGDYSKYVELLKNHYEDLKNPLAAMLRGFKEERDLLALSSQEREIYSELLSKEKELKAQGYIIDEKMRAGLREEIALNKSLVEITNIKDGLLGDSMFQKNAEFANQLKARQELLNNPSSNYTSTDSKTAAMGDLSSMGLDTSLMQSQLDTELAIITNHYAKLEQLKSAAFISDKDYHDAKVQLAEREAEVKTRTASNFFGEMANLQNSNIKELARIGKAAAITQAVINTYVGVTKAIAQGGIYGAVMGAAVLASGMAQVSQIRSQNTTGFVTGGSFVVPRTNGGGADSETVSFKATAGERVTVGTPSQVRKGDKAVQNGMGYSGDGSGASGGVKIINVVVMDKSEVANYIKSYEGENAIVNVISKNANSINGVLANA
jgi:tape measure domain-containing protein